MWRKSSLFFWGIFLSTQLSTSQAQRFNLDSLRQAAVSQAGSGFACADKDTHFELVTGFVYTAPDDMLDSRPGTLMLTDCIELCRRNVTCKSANFETGLCVLFGSSAEDYPGKKMIFWYYFSFFKKKNRFRYLSRPFLATKFFWRWVKEIWFDEFLFSFQKVVGLRFASGLRNSLIWIVLTILACFLKKQAAKTKALVLGTSASTSF